MESNHDRREFLKVGATAGAMFSLSGAAAATRNAAQAEPNADPITADTKKIDPVRVGFVGIGVKGSSHLGSLLRMDGVEVRAVCDILERQCVESQRQAERLGKKKPTAYFRGEFDFQRMCDEQELDLVYTATPWRWHAPICLTAMKTGSHAATEIPAAVTVDECWQLVETAEKTGRYCAMMENVNYRRTEMAIWNMIRKGLLGELVYTEAGYMHDTRYLKSHDYGDGLWLADHHAKRNGCLYPMHAIGPAAWYFDINRGDRFEYLVSMSSKARGLDLYMSEHLPADHPKRKQKYINGDVNCCLMQTNSGCSMTIKHDTDLPRPYSRRNLVQGTRGIVRGFPKFEVCLEGETHHHRWESGDAYLREHDHPLWKFADRNALGKFDAASKKAAPAGPIVAGATWNYAPRQELAGGDFLEDYRLIEALRNGVPPDYDVYDAATWSVVAPLSERSVAECSRPVEFPDFTKGKWKTTSPLKIMDV